MVVAPYDDPVAREGEGEAGRVSVGRVEEVRRGGRGAGVLTGVHVAWGNCVK